MIAHEAPQIASGMATLWPPSYCQTRDLRMIIANGLQRPLIWEPLGGAIDIAITPPSSGPTVSTPAGGAATAGDYYCAYRYYDPVNGTYSALSPLTKVTAAANDKFSYSVVADDSERDSQKQIWRSTYKQNSKLYLITTLDDGTTTYADDTSSDDTLAALGVDSELDIYTADDELWARRQVVPPNYMRVVKQFQDRAFWGVLAIYDVGTVSITNGSATVTGVGTTWPSALEGREIYMIGSDKAYTIETVGSTTSITLDENYAGTTLSGVRYAIMADPAKWCNALIYSPQDEPEYAPSTQNVIVVQENVAGDGDWMTGLVPAGNVLWILKTRHVYSLTFARQPKIDPGVHLRFYRGAFNHRCADYYERTLFLLDAQGPWAIGPGGQFIPLGPPIQDYFRDATVDFGKRTWWFVSVEPNQQVVRFFVTLVGQTGTTPKTALCYGIRTQKWWTETYQEAFGGSTRVEHLGQIRTLVGGQYDRVLMLGTGQSDGVSAQGRVAAASATGISIGAGEMELFYGKVAMIGEEVRIISGPGAGQVRTVLDNYGPAVLVVATWDVTPTTASLAVIQYAISGTVTSATANTLVDSTRVSLSSMSFSQHLAGAPVTITAGTGAGQTRCIKKALYGTLTLTEDWSTTPDETSEYRVGTFNCRCRGGILEIPVVEKEKKGGEDTERAIELVYEPTTIQQTINWRLLWDHATTGEEAWITWAKGGVASVRGSVDHPFDLQKTRSSRADAAGVESIGFHTRASRKVIAHRFLASELQWFQGEERVKLYGLGVE